MGRTNVVINDDLIEEAMKITGAKSRREVIDLALERIVQKNSLLRAAQKLRGKLVWEGDLHKMRKSRM